MSITLSAIARTQLDQVYRALDIVLEKAAAHAETAGVDEDVLVSWRLTPDMLPLIRQVQLVSDFTVRGLSRLAGVDPVSLPDEEASLADLRARIDKARAVVWALDEDAISADPSADITFPAGKDRTMTLSRQAYLQNFILTNALFHASTAYAILRSVGVELGKADIMGLRQL